MSTFGGCESHDLVISHSTFLKSGHSETVTHMLDLQEYGVPKKWVIITEISKEVENDSIVRLNVYTRQYVSRSVRGGESATRAGNGDAGGSY